MPERNARERLADWRKAERAEASTEAGSVERRRAHTASRRARWAFEDAARLASEDHGDTEPASRTQDRAFRRLHEVTNAAAALNPQPRARRGPPETAEEGHRRRFEDAEIARELGELDERADRA